MITYKWKKIEGGDTNSDGGGQFFLVWGGTPHFEGQMGGDKLPMGGSPPPSPPIGENPGE